MVYLGVRIFVFYVDDMKVGDRVRLSEDANPLERQRYWYNRNANREHIIGDIDSRGDYCLEGCMGWWAAYELIPVKRKGRKSPYLVVGDEVRYFTYKADAVEHARSLHWDGEKSRVYSVKKTYEVIYNLSLKEI